MSPETSPAPFWEPELTDDEEAALEKMLERQAYAAVREFLTQDDADHLLEGLVFPGRTLTCDPQPDTACVRLIVEGRNYPNIVRDFSLTKLLEEEIECNVSGDGEACLSAGEAEAFEGLAACFDGLASRVRAFLTLPRCESGRAAKVPKGETGA